MSKLSILVSPTIVLILTFHPYMAASPQNQFPPDSPAQDSESSQPLSDDMQISRPPPVGAPLPTSTARYYPYHQQLTLRYGRASDFPKLRFNDNVTGFQYQFPKFLSPRLEAGADLHDDGDGHVHAGVRWIHNERGYWRPSLKAAADVLIKSQDGLATFVQSDNYYLRTNATLEYVIWNPYSLRLENEWLFGFKNCIYSVTLGLSRGW